MHDWVDWAISRDTRIRSNRRVHLSYLRRPLHPPYHVYRIRQYCYCSISIPLLYGLVAPHRAESSEQRTRVHGFGRWGSDRDCIDFHQYIGGKAANLDAGPRGWIDLKEFLVRCVHFLEIVQGFQVHGRFDHLRKCRTGRFEYCTHVFQALTCLCRDVGADDVFRFLVDRDLARHEDHVVDLDGLTVRPKGRGRRRRGNNDFVVHMRSLTGFSPRRRGVAPSEGRLNRLQGASEAPLMFNRCSMEDTIVAPATGAGPGAIAIVRLSGSRARAFLTRCFKPIGGAKTVNHFSHRQLMLGDFCDPSGGGPIDRVMAVFMESPGTYSGEDMAEIHCHGSPALVARILDVLIAAGARPAEPGEFTRRAFKNGRIDLAQAEAVCDLVRSATDSAGRVALRQLAGGLSARIDEMRRGLIDVAAEIEARLDFPEEEIEEEDRKALESGLRRSLHAIEDLLREGRRGRVLREGVRVVLVGRPNVGKSSLLNALAGRERALVSPHPGTTRDTIECTIDLHGIAVTLVDTAGWRAASDEIERMGVERTESELEVADLLVWVVDAAAALSDEDRLISERIAGLPAVVACNKCDLPPAFGKEGLEALGVEAGRVCRLSATGGEGIDALERMIVERLIGAADEAAGEVPLISNVRHLELLERARESLAVALEAFGKGMSGDLVMVDVRGGLRASDEIVGREFDEEMLDAVFSRFCIGK